MLNSELVILALHVPDGTHKKLAIPSRSTAEDLLNEYAKKSGLSLPQLFGIKEVMSNGTERWVPMDSPILDVLEDSDSKIYIKLKIFKTFNPNCVDIQTLRMCFLQYRKLIISGSVYLSEYTAMRLAGLAVQIELGDHNSAIHVVGMMDDNSMDSLVPVQFIKKFSNRYWQRRIFNFHKVLVGLSVTEAMLKYLETARAEITAIGMDTWRAEILNKKSKGGNSVKGSLGIAEEGVFLSLEAPINNKPQHWHVIPFESVERFEPDEAMGQIEVTSTNGKHFLVTLFRLHVAEANDRFNMYKSVHMRAATTLAEQRNGWHCSSYFLPPLPRPLSPPNLSILAQIKDNYLIKLKEANMKPISRILVLLDLELDRQGTLTNLNLSKVDNLKAEDVSLFFDVFGSLQRTSGHDNFRPTTLDLSGNPGSFPQLFQSLTKFLRSYSLVESLNLSNNNFGKQASELVLMLETPGLQLTHLTEVNLSGNQIPPKLISRVIDGLRNCHQLTSLSLADNAVKDQFSDSFTSILKKSDPALTHLDLCDCKLSDSFVSKLCRSYEDLLSPELRILRLSNNSLSNKSMARVIALSAHIGSLRTLTISGNSIPTKAGIQLGDQLSSETFKLKRLIINNCSLDKKVILHIAEALRFNKSLKSLQIARTTIDDPTASAFRESLSRHNSVLRVLNLSFCSMTAQASEEIGLILLTNSTLKTLDFSGLALTASLTDQIGSALVVQSQWSSDLNSSILPNYSSKNLLSEWSRHPSAVRPVSVVSASGFSNNAECSSRSRSLLSATTISIGSNGKSWRETGEDLNKDNEKDAISEYSSDRIPGLRALCLSYPDSEPENAALLWESIGACARIERLLLHGWKFNAATMTEMLVLIGQSENLKRLCIRNTPLSPKVLLPAIQAMPRKPSALHLQIDRSDAEWTEVEMAGREKAVRVVFD